MPVEVITSRNPVDDELVANIVSQTVDAMAPRGLFTFNSPRQTVVGEGSVLKLGALLRKRDVAHVLIVVDEVVYQRGLMASAQRCLSRVDIQVTIFPKIAREPSNEVIEQGLIVLAQCKADFIIGFGGGSAMDAAKAIALMASCNVSLEEISASGFEGQRNIGLGAVPTTAGTGSEVTDITVIMDSGRMKKYVAKNGELMPDLAVIDPALMLELPATVTAATGIDALTHAIEAYVASGSNPLSCALATAAISSIPLDLPRAVGNGGDIQSRLGMAVAAYKAGLAFGNSGLGLVHAISHQVGAHCGVAHGVANGILLPYVMEFNALVCRSEYADIAKAMGVTRESMNVRQQAQSGIAAIRQLANDIGLPSSFAEFGLRVEDIGPLADAALQDICITTNPRSVEKSDIVNLLRQVAST